MVIIIFIRIIIVGIIRNTRFMIRIFIIIYILLKFFNWKLNVMIILYILIFSSFISRL